MIQARKVDASYFLEASAGTGKTTQLIDQIVRCVGAGTKLKGVVAVTFTHMAAGEMKLRLREELGKAGESSADLELAFVGTIHAFCARLLRERPVEAGVDPRFVELDQEAAAKLFAGVFRRWVERRLSALNPALRRALTRLTWRDDGEGRDALASLRKAAWSLIEWRDHPAPWARPPFDRTAPPGQILQDRGILFASCRFNYRRALQSGVNSPGPSQVNVVLRLSCIGPGAAISADIGSVAEASASARAAARQT